MRLYRISETETVSARSRSAGYPHQTPEQPLRTFHACTTRASCVTTRNNVILTVIFLTQQDGSETDNCLMPRVHLALIRIPVLLNLSCVNYIYNTCWALAGIEYGCSIRKFVLTVYIRLYNIIYTLRHYRASRKANVGREREDFCILSASQWDGPCGDLPEWNRIFVSQGRPVPFHFFHDVFDVIYVKTSGDVAAARTHRALLWRPVAKRGNLNKLTGILAIHFIPQAVKSPESRTRLNRTFVYLIKYNYNEHEHFFARWLYIPRKILHHSA